ncbi:hypothetical protein SAMN06265349_10649 [Flavobacterium resistens]|uniref:Uncharacterized protein n=1 Tax=Flavobacterium resistens TaxID=443612 RepID=A0A521F019_9FLAO|nr:hypothetical protein [Flavobacterium resistens]MRX69353.1 hypothetical protein [Flavobacterium resistens]SMO89416.1 hypothetical protein SAMN06265349_10649 [Flavobacterium resistens]
MTSKYILKLNNEIIGYTKFEFSDVPMGVIHGKVILEGIESPYNFFKDHCTKFDVQINSDYPEDEFIATVIIPQLEVFLENGKKLKGWGGSISGVGKDDFEIQFCGITSEVMQTEFNHHFLKYYSKK